MSSKGLFIGSSSLDFISLISNELEKNGKQRAIKQCVQAGGLACNASITFSYLGGQTKLLTCIGKSEIANICRNDIEKYKVNLTDFAP
ncbi:MAG: PfkB family carbohydrate kinase, partial [Pseudomonadota bacterium]